MKQERDRILRLTVAAFIRESFDLKADGFLAQRLASIADRLETSADLPFIEVSRKGRATVADFLEMPDRPLQFNDPVRDVLGCWRGAGKSILDAVYSRIAELGIAADPKGFQALPVRTKRALRNSGIGNGSPTRADIAAVFGREGIEGLRRRLSATNSGEHAEIVARWLGVASDEDVRRPLLHRIEKLRGQLKRAEEKLAALDAPLHHS